jgi:hypothetical protein
MAEHNDIEKTQAYEGFDENLDAGYNEKTEVEMEDVPAAVTTADVEVQSVHGLKRELKSRHLQMSKSRTIKDLCSVFLDESRVYDLQSLNSTSICLIN